MTRLAPLAALFLVACPTPEPEPPPGVLEIGVKQADGTFRALAPSDPMTVSLGPNGLNMVVPSLRSAEIDPRAPDPTVTLTIEGNLMAKDIEGSRVDMRSDGTGYVLWDLRVPFQSELCCFICRAGEVTATIRDASGRRFEGKTTVRLERGAGCPDEKACCKKADTCKDPSMTQLCQ